MDPVSKGVIGGFFVLVGFVMVLFRRDVKKFYEDLFGVLLEIMPLAVRGRALTVLIPVFGVLSIIGGGIVLLLAVSV